MCVFHASPTKAPDLQPLVQGVGGQPSESAKSHRPTKNRLLAQ